MNKGVWFGLTLMALVVAATILLLPPFAQMTGGHLGLLMLALIVVAIMLGFPTAFTLMGMGMMFAWFAYDFDTTKTLDLMVQRTYGVMANDVLISIPLFVFMGYLVERANLIEKLFKSLHLATARVPGSLAVATIITCAIFATATGIVGAVVTLMGLLALPAMLRAGYNVRLATGAITAGGCLGILIPPSVMLIVYGATAGVSVVQLYAGAFFPGIMLAFLYLGYVIVLAKLKPAHAPSLPAEERQVPLPGAAQALSPDGTRNALSGFAAALSGNIAGSSPRAALANLLVASLPFMTVAAILGATWHLATAPAAQYSTEGLVEMGGAMGTTDSRPPPDVGGLQEPPSDAGGLQEPPTNPGGTVVPPTNTGGTVVPPRSSSTSAGEGATAAAQQRTPTPGWFWWIMAGCGAALALFYALLDLTRLQIFKLLLGSFFPLAVLILAVLGAIIFGWATPTEAAAIGALGGFLLALAYRFHAKWQALGAGSANRFGAAAAGAGREVGPILKESSFLTAKTSAMVCWLFVGSSIFSAAFALLGGQDLIEKWVLSLDLSPLQFMVLSQVIIFLLGWPLEWTEIIVIFMPIFIPLLPHFQIDPLFFGLLVALNLQTAFLSPPVAMAAFYLKGVSPPHVTLNQIFLGMLPFMLIQVIAVVLLYTFPAIGMWLPQTLYR
ncbi:MAG: TRAP transporter large permease subunit [Betaproteobacteria bacterium]|nr:TRAP transporter large permease subunit [Betaproteobacteria bacterium]